MSFLAVLAKMFVFILFQMKLVVFCSLSVIQ